MADFSNFELGDNVAELAGAVITEMAEVFEVNLSQSPSAEELGNLVGAIGTSKVLQENIGQVQEKLGVGSDAITIAAGWLGRSGVQLALNRSLWTPNVTAADETAVVLTGAVANWQDRAAQTVLWQTAADHIYIPVGNRLMDTATEKTNPNIEQFFAGEGEYPTEQRYALEFIAPILSQTGDRVTVVGYDTNNGDMIAARFVEDYRALFSKPIRFARVANAGIQLASQFVRAARAAGIDFDADRNNPMAYVLTDEFPIAQTPEQQANPKEFQNPFTGIRQIAVTAKELTSIQP
jgi:hypothetical protein